MKLLSLSFGLLIALYSSAGAAPLTKQQCAGMAPGLQEYAAMLSKVLGGFERGDVVPAGLMDETGPALKRAGENLVRAQKATVTALRELRNAVEDAAREFQLCAR
jgi:hypothetical protein